MCLTFLFIQVHIDDMAVIHAPPNCQYTTPIHVLHLISSPDPSPHNDSSLSSLQPVYEEAVSTTAKATAIATANNSSLTTRSIPNSGIYDTISCCRLLLVLDEQASLTVKQSFVSIPPQRRLLPTDVFVPCTSYILFFM